MIKMIGVFFYVLVILYPVVTIIHEFGHVFAVLILKGNILEFVIGDRKQVFKFGFLTINWRIWGGGGLRYEFNYCLSRMKKVILFSSGIMANLASLMTTVILINTIDISSETIVYMIRTFNQITIIFLITNLLPIKIAGSKTDAKLVLDLFLEKTVDQSY